MRRSLGRGGGGGTMSGPAVHRYTPPPLSPGEVVEWPYTAGGGEGGGGTHSPSRPK